MSEVHVYDGEMCMGEWVDVSKVHVHDDKVCMGEWVGVGRQRSARAFMVNVNVCMNTAMKGKPT